MFTFISISKINLGQDKSSLYVRFSTLVDSNETTEFDSGLINEKCVLDFCQYLGTQRCNRSESACYSQLFVALNFNLWTNWKTFQYKKGVFLSLTHITTYMLYYYSYYSNNFYCLYAGGCFQALLKISCIGLRERISFKDVFSDILTS